MDGGTAGTRRAHATRAGLERGQIVEAARELVAAEGVEALSMRRLARRLGVAPMSLYRHVAGKEQLLELTVEAIAARLPALDPDGPWEAAVGDLFASLRRLLLDHPGVAPLVTKRTLFTPSVLRVVDAGLAALLRGGLTPAAAARAFLTLWTFTLGSVAAEEALAARGRAGTVEAERQRVVAELLAAAGPLPALAAAAPHWARLDGEQAFRAGLSLVLDGVRASR